MLHHVEVQKPTSKSSSQNPEMQNSWLTTSSMQVSLQESIGIAPSFADKGYHPRTRLGLEPPGAYERRGEAEIKKVDKITERVRNMRDGFKISLFGP
jgi:hypothetical protein